MRGNGLIWKSLGLKGKKGEPGEIEHFGHRGRWGQVYGHFEIKWCTLIGWTKKNIYWSFQTSSLMLDWVMSNHKYLNIKYMVRWIRWQIVDVRKFQIKKYDFVIFDVYIKSSENKCSWNITTKSFYKGILWFLY